ncbi:MAG: hypothetical protein JWN44_679 [Myxococcales bacterium]|nr:hypothetical protein [Myxococcales bacterium]
MKWSAVFLLLLPLVSGCYLKPSASNSPLQSPDGVSVTLLGQDCEDHSGADGDPISRDLGVKVRFDNRSEQPLHVSEQSIVLAVDSSHGPIRGPSDLVVRPHDSAVVQLDFTHHALCYTGHEFVIIWNDALALGDRPLRLADLSLRP